MLKAIAHTKGRSVVILGLDRTNTERLLAGQPIVVAVDAMDPTLGAVDVLLMGGEDVEAIRAELTAYMGPPMVVRDERPPAGEG